MLTPESLGEAKAALVASPNSPATPPPGKLCELFAEVRGVARRGFRFQAPTAADLDRRFGSRLTRGNYQVKEVRT